MPQNKFRLYLAVFGILFLVVIILFLVNKKSAAENNREEISIVLSNIAANAHTHYKRTNNFAGWSIPASLRIDEIGTFREKIENELVTIYVVGKERGENGISNVNLESKITGNKHTIKIRN